MASPMIVVITILIGFLIFSLITSGNKARRDNDRANAGNNGSSSNLQAMDVPNSSVAPNQASSVKVKNAVLAAPSAASAALAQLLKITKRCTITVSLSILGGELDVATSAMMSVSPHGLHELPDTVFDALSLIKTLLSLSDVYLLANVKDDGEQGRVLAALTHLRIVGDAAGMIPAYRVLFSENQVGKCSSIRQLEPTLHMDADSETVAEVSRFLNRIILISPTAEGAPSTTTVAGVQGKSVEVTRYSPAAFHALADEIRNVIHT